MKDNDLDLARKIINDEITEADLKKIVEEELLKYNSTHSDCDSNYSSDQMTDSDSESTQAPPKPVTEEEIKEIMLKIKLLARKTEKESKAREILDHLKIPHKNGRVIATDLADVLTDEKKFQELCSRLKMKAFW